jgi:hypothetical protein
MCSAQPSPRGCDSPFGLSATSGLTRGGGGARVCSGRRGAGAPEDSISCGGAAGGALAAACSACSAASARTTVRACTTALQLSPSRRRCAARVESVACQRPAVGTITTLAPSTWLPAAASRSSAAETSTPLGHSAGADQDSAKGSRAAHVREPPQPTARPIRRAAQGRESTPRVWIGCRLSSAAIERAPDRQPLQQALGLLADCSSQRATLTTRELTDYRAEPPAPALLLGHASRRDLSQFDRSVAARGVPCGDRRTPFTPTQP